MARKKVVVKDNDSESDSDDSMIAKKIKVESPKKKVIQEESESDDDQESAEEMVYSNNLKHPNESAKVESSYPLSFKLQLMNEIKNNNKRKTSSYKVALRHFDWSAIKIEGYTVADYKACLEEIMKPICSLRTLEEMMNDYESHHQKYELKMHPDAPKVPRNAVMKFIDDNRDKIKNALRKEFPDKPTGLKEISSYGAKMFAELSEKEQEKYKLQYKLQLKDYAEKKAELLKQCPELVKKRVRKPKDPKVPKVKAVASKRKRPELPYITPFMIFREELAKEGRDVSLHDAQAMYKHMPDDEKMKYIQDLLLLDTHLEKQFSSQERKIMKNSNGMPQKPLTAYNLFVKDLCKGDVLGDKREMLKTSSATWKTLSEEQKRHYEDLHNEAVEAWQVKMEEWFKTLPIEQRAEHMAKHGFLTKVESTKKRRRTVASKEQPDISDMDQSNKRKKSNPHETEMVIVKKEEAKEKSVINVNPVGASKLKQITNVVAVYSDADQDSPKKKKKKAENSDFTSEESTPKKKKFKEAIESFGPYPSLKTSHYFMTQKYIGKPHKVAKSYNKLTKDEKKRLYEEMKKAKIAYFAKLKYYLNENGHHAEKVRQFHENSRREQEESITWHTDYGTDRSDDSDSSGDSDSS